MKGIFGKAFLVTLLFSQLPVSAMSPAAVQTIVTPGAARLLVNSGRQALAKVGQRIAQDPALASGSVALVSTLGTASLVSAAVNGLNKKPAVVQEVAKPGFKQMAKNAGTWVKDAASNTYVFIKDHALLSSGIAAGTIVLAGGVYYFVNKSRKNKAKIAAELNEGLLKAQAEAFKGYKAQDAQSAKLNAEAMVNHIAQMTKENEVKSVEVKAWYNPRRYFGGTSVKAEQKPEVTPAAQATEVKEEEATEVKPGMMKHAKVAAVSALSTANDYTLKPLWNNKGKVVTALGLGAAVVADAKLNGGKLTSKALEYKKTIGGIAAAGALGAGYAYQGKWSVRHPLTWGSASAQVVQGPATKLESDIASAKSKLEDREKQQPGLASTKLYANALNLAVEGTQEIGDNASFERLAKTVAEINNL